MRGFLIMMVLAASMAGSVEAAQIRLLVITGSHPFDPRFYALFEGHPDISWDKKAQTEKPCAAFTPGFAEGYDAVLLYDFEMTISDEQKQAFEEAFGGGRGLIVLHHALCSHPGWPKYREIAGGQFLFDPREGMRASTYKGNEEVTYTPADPDHPALRGVKPFSVVEEPYNHVWRPEDAQPLLTADHEESDKVVAWSTQYQQSRVVAIEPGHGGDIFVDPDYRTFIAQTIRWVSGRPPAEE